MGTKSTKDVNKRKGEGRDRTGGRKRESQAVASRENGQLGRSRGEGRELGRIPYDMEKKSQ